MNTLITFLAAATLSAADPAGMLSMNAVQASHLGLDLAAGPVYRNIDIGSDVDSVYAKHIEGTTQSITLSAFEQRPANSTAFLNQTADGRWCESGSTSAFADIQLQLPDDSTVTSMRVWGFDTSAAENMTVSLIERCTPNNVAGGVITSVIAEITPSQSSGNFSQVTAIGANNSIDTDACSYTLRTRYSTPGSQNFCAGSTLRLQKIRLGYTPP
jgi:hypothetical protein